MKPFFLDLSDSDFKEKIKQGYRELQNCNLCPRKCGVNRIKGETAVCDSDWRLKIASWNLHFGEEPPLSGTRGSGTIFFSNCNLLCKYCQNYSISQLGVGNYYSVKQLSHMMLKLQKRGAHNINLVTPDHFVPQIINALYKARVQGLIIPIVYNTSGYNSINQLKLISGLVDIYLVDMRYSESKFSKRYSYAPNYPEINRRAIIEMHKQVGNLILQDGIARKGIIIRHLVLPEGVSGADDIFRFLSREISKETYISLMDQYFPCYKVINAPILGRRITPTEYEKAKYLMDKYELTRGWVQEHI